MLTPKGLRPRFTLSALLIAVLLVSLPLGCIAHRLRQKKRERAVYAYLNRRAQTAYYDWELSTGPHVPAGPQWLRSILGNEFFSEVSEVNFTDVPGLFKGDGDLALLDDLKAVKSISIPFSKITDCGLRHCSYLASMEFLNLNNCEGFSDNGLKYVERMHGLKVLWIGGTKTTDSGLKHLRGLTQLENLGLWDTKVTDAGMCHIVELRDLRVLDLRGTATSDESIPLLARLQKLEVLRLSGTKVGASGAADLRRRVPLCDVVR